MINVYSSREYDLPDLEPQFLDVWLVLHRRMRENGSFRELRIPTQSGH